MKSHEIVQRPRADFVFPVIPHPLEGFCSRIFNLYHFPVQNVIWSNMQQEKIHSRYKYYSIPSLHFGLTINTIFFRFQLSSYFYHFIKDESNKLWRMIKCKEKQKKKLETLEYSIVYFTRCSILYRIKLSSDTLLYFLQILISLYIQYRKSSNEFFLRNSTTLQFYNIKFIMGRNYRNIK